MKRTFLFHFMGFMLLIGLVINPTGLHLVQAQAANQADLTLTDLAMVGPQTLTSPISEFELRFNLPANWTPEGTASLDLELSAYFSSLVASESTATLSGLVGGDLSVYLNDVLVNVNTLQQSGAQTLHIEFDAASFKPVSRDDVNTLRIRWDGSVSCQTNLLSSVTIMPTSKLAFGYSETTDHITLNNFPAPFVIENSLQPVPLVIALPVSPTAGELQAAMIVAAGIGQISHGAQTAVVIKTDDFQPSASAKQNVILVANSDTLKSLPVSEWGITVNVQAGAGEGLLRLFQPAGGYGLLVTGDDLGIVKAAQTASADQVIAAGDAMSMIVSGINPVAPVTGQEDMTLEDLGVGELVFTQPSNLVKSFDFFVPAGNQVRSDASFELTISHSQQLDYLRSGLQVKVNGFPAVSLRLTDNTSNQNLFQLIMPANLIHPGRNTIEFVADLSTRDLCTAATESVAWLRVSSSSLLHLPLESAVGGTMLPKTFGDFPDAFLTGSGLNNVTLQIAQADFGNIQAAAKLAARLGAALPSHTIFQVSAVGTDATLPADASVILVGRPSDFSGLTEKTQFPSLAFNPDDSLSDQSALQLVTKPEAEADAGYLAIRGFDAMTSRVLLAVLGNTSAGVSFAVEALGSPQTANNNFALVTGPAELTGWLDQGIATGEISAAGVQPTQIAPGGDPVQIFRSGMLAWVVPALVILLALMLLFVYMEIRQNIRKMK